MPLDPTERRLGRAHTIADLRKIAARRLPRAVFDYADGAADQEASLRRARASFARAEFHPRALRDVSNIDTGTTVLGRRWPLPFALAPTGFTRMMHHDGERAAVAAAQRAGVTFALSTMGTTSIEQLAAEAPGAHKWFQLYVWRDRAAGQDLVERAQAAGYEALVLTVDTPVGGARMRDVRNGLTIPPALTPSTVLDAALHPAWWLNLLTTEPLTFASLHEWHGTVAELVNTMFDPSVTFADVEWLRSAWPGPLLLKGIHTVADARAAVDHGAIHAAATASPGRSPGAVLADVLEVVQAKDERDGLGGVALLAWAEALRNPSLAGQFKALLTQLRADLAEVAGEYQGAGGLPSGVPADCLAAVLIAVVPGYILQLALLGGAAVDGIPDAVRAL